MSTEAILAKHQVENPSDAALIRLTAEALSLPDQSAEALMKRAGLVNEADRAVGNALIDTVRSHSPAPVIKTGKAGLAWTVAAILAVSSAAFGTLWYRASADADSLSRSLEQREAAATERVKSLQQDFQNEVAKLQADYTSSRSASDEQLQKNIDAFSRNMSEQVERINALTRDNARLENDLKQAQLELERLREEAARAASQPASERN